MTISMTTTSGRRKSGGISRTVNTPPIEPTKANGNITRMIFLSIVPERR